MGECGLEGKRGPCLCPPAPGTLRRVRIYGISDLHVDFAPNLEQVASLPVGPHRGDTLLVAGDICHRMDRAEEALGLLADRFEQVFLVPGNHDLWVEDPRADAGGPGAQTSLDRLEALRRLAARLGIEMEPGAAGSEWWVLPLHGWYEPGFGAAGAPEVAVSRHWSDPNRCRWPPEQSSDADRCAYFEGLNRPALRTPPGRRVLSFSHFVPRPELIPPLEGLRFKELPRVSGTLRLDRQLRAAGSRLHLFGHTHIAWDAVIDGVRYVQRPLAYPHERARRGESGIELVRLV